MSRDYAHSGMGFPNGPVDLRTIFDLPSADLLMLVTEARWHYDEAVLAGKTVLWRAIPRLGYRPAELHWNASKFAEEALNQAFTIAHSLTDFVWANELDLQDERGDEQDDWNNLATRYKLIGQFASQVVRILRTQPETDQARLHFPAFTPDHEALSYIDFWRDAALQHDVIDFHAYDSLDDLPSKPGIRSWYQSYRSVFPEKDLALTEWHCRGDVEEERRVLQWLADTMAADPLFRAAYRFIWRWDNPAEWWDPSFNVEGRDDMLTLFHNPPMPAVVEPEPVKMTRDQILELIVTKAHQYGLVPYEFLGGAIAESQLDPEAWRQEVWPDWSAGLYQQTVAFADEGDHSASEENVALIKQLYFDPVHACDVAAVKYHYWRYNPDVPAETAWVAYNGPSYYHTPEQSPNLENYRRSLAQAAQMLGVVIEQPEGRTYGPDVPSEVIRQHNTWSCAVRSTYGALWSMAQLGHGEPVTYGDEGPRDVYDWLVPKYDDPSVGLHDHTGTGLVEALKAHGYTASNLYPTSLASVQARAGMQPVLLGGDAWNHWVMVRGLESDGTLILENPMPGFAGISDELRDSFGRLGPMAMVWIDVPQEPGGDVTEAEAAALRAENQHLRDMLGYASHDIAVAIQKEIDTIKPSLDALESANNTLKQQTP